MLELVLQDLVSAAVNHSYHGASMNGYHPEYTGRWASTAELREYKQTIYLTALVSSSDELEGAPSSNHRSPFPAVNLTAVYIIKYGLVRNNSLGPLLGCLFRNLADSGNLVVKIGIVVNNGALPTQVLSQRFQLQLRWEKGCGMKYDQRGNAAAKHSHHVSKREKPDFDSIISSDIVDRKNNKCSAPLRQSPLTESPELQSKHISK
ncbi:hypothetical protein B0H19DRAFT_1084684 [Mycena capillaripes]|nr:hypothetical protein B0H19DRAFT_1084684 [Mycena capillaripes]